MSKRKKLKLIQMGTSGTGKSYSTKNLLADNDFPALKLFKALKRIAAVIHIVARKKDREDILINLIDEFGAVNKMSLDDKQMMLIDIYVEHNLKSHKANFFKRLMKWSDKDRWVEITPKK